MESVSPLLQAAINTTHSSQVFIFYISFIIFHFSLQLTNFLQFGHVTPSPKGKPFAGFYRPDHISVAQSTGNDESKYI